MQRLTWNTLIAINFLITIKKLIAKKVQDAIYFS